MTRCTHALVVLALAAVVACEEQPRRIGMTKNEPAPALSSASATASASTPPSTSASAAPSTISQPGAVAQLHYGPASLTGTLSEETFPGPPGYGTDPSHDAKEPVLVLQLFAPIDVLRTDGDDAWNEDRIGVRKVSIATTKDPALDLRQQLGRAIKVRGKLIGAHSPKHHTDVLMSDVEMVPE